MNTSSFSRFSLLLGAGAVFSLSACNDHPLKPVEYEALQERQDAISLAVNKDVDILFVIDNSGSMAEEQATLAKNFASFINVLEAPDVKANYRIGVTTTDNGNIYCGATSPEAGKLQLTSCRSRQGEFVFNGMPVVDATQEACLDVCRDGLDQIEIQPTEIVGEGAAPRTWLENIEGRTNLPEGVSTVEAFQCFGPQGINGCGYESHLESMRKALARARNSDEDDFGFIRENAILAIVHVTDEADCSANNKWNTIFDANGNREFWSNPEDGSPTSAVCWNAGVKCDGMGIYDTCDPANFDADGNEITDAGLARENAVLYPVETYIDYVQGLEDSKQIITPDQEVLVAVIGGSNPDGTISYQDAPQDPVFQENFGIGPGCKSAGGEAVPPVRLRDFAEAFQVGDASNLFSICQDDYSQALRAIATAIADQVKPACMTACVADADPTTPEVLDPQCTLTQEIPTGGGNVDESSIAQCNGDELPDGVNVCYQALVGADRDEVCVDAGFNLEFRLIRRDGFPAPGGTQVKATCQLSRNQAIDCPGL